MLTNLPLKQVLQKLNALGRLLKWAVELEQLDISFRSQTVIKGQALADFIAEFTYRDSSEEQVELGGQVKSEKHLVLWKVFMDGSSTEEGAGARIVLINPEDHKIHCALRLGFNASNNKVEYEALLTGYV